MGNKIGRRREVVDDKYTRPQGHYQLRGIDEKKLRKLIIESKLAPCYPGLDEHSLDLDECPICFLFYPRLNRSKCCRKMICTECFLQIKPSRPNRPIKCPFCKTHNYVVEYRGVRTKEEKRMEQIEEQRVVEARIRMRQQELRDEEERSQKRKITSSSNRIINSEGVQVPYWSQGDGLISSQGSCSLSAGSWHSCLSQSREDALDMDLENIMVLEAVWFPAQRHGAIEDDPGSGRNFARRSLPQDFSTSPVRSLDSISSSSQSMVGSYRSESRTEVVSSNKKASVRECYGCRTDHEVIREEGFGNASSNLAVGTGIAPSSLSESVVATSHHFPDSFEEQMMLVMAVSLAENLGGFQGVTWLQ